jgi:hypothetical protein
MTGETKLKNRLQQFDRWEETHPTLSAVLGVVVVAVAAVAWTVLLFAW